MAVSRLDRPPGRDRSSLRAAVEQGTVDALLKDWNADAARFAEQVRPYLIYR